MKKVVLVLPEVILLGLSGYWFLDNLAGGNHFNAFAFVTMLILLFQIIFQNKYVAFTLATLISLFSVYMVLAVLSEFHDFPSITSEALKLLSFGLIFCFLMFASSIMMVYKFLPKVF